MSMKYDDDDDDIFVFFLNVSDLQDPQSNRIRFLATFQVSHRIDRP